MWVYLETWIVQDGAPELARGVHLRGVGLRADRDPAIMARYLLDVTPLAGVKGGEP